MNKRELWENFMKTGRVSDYLKYKKAQERPSFGFEDDNLTEFSEELSEDFQAEDN
ncbi:MAG: hypothetical protein IKB94_03090 [Clostridia bacterium]|nr:hypothetical protein [Clostridia bacterium]MBR2892818.1 hypothetical protein [Clostridia bacterium]